MWVLSQLWEEVLVQLGPLLARELSEAESPIFVHPNSLIVRFSSKESGRYEFCRDPNRLARIQTALSRLTGHDWNVYLERNCLARQATVFLRKSAVFDSMRA